jgi:hypothetical protein
VSALTVSNEAEIDQVVSQYIIQGFTVVNRMTGHATLLKKKELNGTTLVLCLVLGLVVCEIPLIIYLIVYLTQSDRMVQINVASAAADGQYSPDGRWRWVNGEWVPSGLLPPPEAGSPVRLPEESFITPGDEESKTHESQATGQEEAASVDDSVTETPPNQGDTVPMPDLTQEVTKKRSEGGSPDGT